MERKYCTVCGKKIDENEQLVKGMCRACYAKNYREENDYWKTYYLEHRKEPTTETNVGKMCKECGKREAKVKGMCKTCYARTRYREKTGHHIGEDKRSEQTLNILAEYKNGAEVKDLAEKYDISRQRIYKLIKKDKERK